MDMDSWYIFIFPCEKSGKRYTAFALSRYKSVIIGLAAADLGCLLRVCLEVPRLKQPYLFPALSVHAPQWRLSLYLPESFAATESKDQLLMGFFRYLSELLPPVRCERKRRFRGLSSRYRWLVGLVQTLSKPDYRNARRRFSPEVSDLFSLTYAPQERKTLLTSGRFDRPYFLFELP
nr:hypothetical protein Iba_chr08aCG11220 [Ipomoea batatas]